MPNPHLITLGSLCAGQAEELFQRELGVVLENIKDVNVDHRKSRSITLVVTFDPTEDRQSANVRVDCSSKLPSVKSVGSVVLIGQDDGRLAAAEVVQEQLFQTPHHTPTLVGDLTDAVARR